MPVVVGGASSQTPGLRTFSSLKDEVARYVMGPDDTEVLAVAGMGINNALRRMNLRTWYWMLDYTDITLTASTADYNLPANFKAARNLWLLDSASAAAGQIGYLDPKTFDLTYSVQGGTTGSPCAYTVYSFLDTFQLSFNIPCSTAFIASYPTARLRFHARTPVLVNNTDTAALPSEAELYVLWYAKFETAMQFDPEKSRTAKSESEQVWQMLVRDDNEHHFHDWS